MCSVLGGGCACTAAPGTATSTDAASSTHAEIRPMAFPPRAVGPGVSCRSFVGTYGLFIRDAPAPVPAADTKRPQRTGSPRSGNDGVGGPLRWLGAAAPSRPELLQRLVQRPAEGNGLVHLCQQQDATNHRAVR